MAGRELVEHVKQLQPPEPDAILKLIFGKLEVPWESAAGFCLVTAFKLTSFARRFKPSDCLAQLKSLFIV